MTLRRYTPLRKSAGTRIAVELRKRVLERDGYECVGHKRLNPPMPGECASWLGLELDHVRASHGTGLKSPTEISNLVSLCPMAHREKTEHGRRWRPVLLLYLAERGAATTMRAEL